MNFEELGEPSEPVELSNEWPKLVAEPPVLVLRARTARPRRLMSTGREFGLREEVDRRGLW